MLNSGTLVTTFDIFDEFYEYLANWSFSCQTFEITYTYTIAPQKVIYLLRRYGIESQPPMTHFYSAARQISNLRNKNK